MAKEMIETNGAFPIFHCNGQFAFIKGLGVEDSLQLRVRSKERAQRT